MASDPITDAAEGRTCTCHPDDRPPGACPRRYAASECQTAALLDAAFDLLVAAERHIFGDECLAERDALRAAIRKAVRYVPIAQAMSAGTAKTEGLGAKPASAVGETDAPESPLP